MQRVAQWTGWSLIVAGVHVALYLVYLLFFTGLETERAQADLLEAWELEVGAFEDAVSAQDVDALPGEGEGEQVEQLPAAAGGGAVALMAFERPDSATPPVTGDVLSVVEGVTLADLRSGPGHYPSTPGPGADGNFAISGHRTTYAAPFYDADQLLPGDLMHVVDRDGVRWSYEVVTAPDRCRDDSVSAAACIVSPRGVWVIGDDPLGDGQPLMTLTTCHPRFSARERLVVFARLVTT